MRKYGIFFMDFYQGFFFYLGWISTQLYKIKELTSVPQKRIPSPVVIPYCAWYTFLRNRLYHAKLRMLLLKESEPIVLHFTLYVMIKVSKSKGLLVCNKKQFSLVLQPNHLNCVPKILSWMDTVKKPWSWLPVTVFPRIVSAKTILFWI